MPNPIEWIKKTISNKFMEKTVKRGAIAAIGIMTPLMVKYMGVQLTDEQITQAQVVLAATLLGFANGLKNKYPKVFGWL